jgi:transposase
MNRKHRCPKAWKDARRKWAFELKQHGWKPREIAEAFVVFPAAVSQWLAKLREHGVEAWLAKPRPMGPVKLTDAQLRLIPELLAHSAEACGFRGEVWTFARVATVIREEFGVSDHNRTTVFVDQSGFDLLPGMVGTYAPCRQSPVLRWPYIRHHVSVMSGVTMDVCLSTLVCNEALDSLDRVIVLRHSLIKGRCARFGGTWCEANACGAAPSLRGDLAASEAGGNAPSVLPELGASSKCARFRH